MVLAANADGTWLIRQARCYPNLTPCDVRIAAGRVTAIGALEPLPGEQLIEAHGGCLLPGLIDHHIHLRALAAQSTSVLCGPPQTKNQADLIKTLSRAPGTDWIRGVGYHESVAGDLTRADLDQLGPARPIRIQHRSGRLWILNSQAIQRLERAIKDGERDPPPLQVPSDGRLFDQDQALGFVLRASNEGGLDPNALNHVSTELASYGLTGIHDLSLIHI